MIISKRKQGIKLQTLWFI